MENEDQKQDRPIVAYCRSCGKGLAQDAVVNFQGVVYCQEHVPQQQAYSPYTAPPPSTEISISAGLAFVLGLIPGVGAIYNGQYVKGFIHVLVTAVIISMVEHGTGLDAFAPLLIPAWFCYMAFEAYHTARKRLAKEPVDEFSSILPLQAGQGGVPVAALLLIGLGVVLLLHQMELIDMYRIRRYIAPMVLIGSGLAMLYGRLKDGAPSGGASSQPGEVIHGRN